MDRAQITSLLQRATIAINVAQDAQQLSAELNAPATVRVGRVARLGDESSMLHIVAPQDLQWSSNFYVCNFFEGIDAHSHIARFQAAVAVLPGLVQRVRAGQGGMLKRLFNPTAVQDGDSAAFDIAFKLDEIESQQLEVIRLLDAAQVARRTQEQGVHFFPGIHGVGQRFIDAARNELAQSLDLHAPQFQQWVVKELNKTRGIVRSYADDHNSDFRLRAAAEQCLDALNAERVQVLLEQLPVEALRTATDQRLRFGDLSGINVATVADVLRASASLLTTVSGIGPQTAQRMKAAAQTLEREAMNRQTTFIGDAPSSAAVSLIRVLARFDQIEEISPAERERRQRVIDYVHQIESGPAEYIVLGSGTDKGARIWEQLHDDLLWVNANPNLFHPQHIKDPGLAAWDDYKERPAHYQGLLSTLLGRDVEGADELLDSSILQRIRDLKLQRGHLKDLHLRGYQSFGARFIVVQKKVLLGDDMGLGKTVQALAVAAHLTETEEDFRTLVVVPASVIVNWVRECRRFSDLPVFVAHGEAKESAVAAWSDSTGILICTFDGARTLDLPTPGLFIADEAHLLKNPQTKRSKACAALIKASDYALLMTGTPLENQVGEFVNLVRYLQPDLITRGMSTMSATAFREQIAPAYLRRNQTDVLEELPERTDSIDWIDLSAADRSSYDQQVLDGSWMGMRRSAMLTPAGQRESAKMERIKELIDETQEHNRKALIFTYFIDVLDELEQHLGDRVVGRISGSVPATARQDMVDALGKAPAGSVLIAQITAGGVGLNIQSASVCIICEAQVKPTLEQQAVARVHRMGQTATVQVHRLIGDETVDERMLEMLAGKREIFDVYARLSESAEVPDAVDISESQLAASIIDAERARLGIDGL